jgi:CBS domain-containing protein
MTWTVRDVMTKEVVTVTADTDFKTCVDLIGSKGVSALPVVDGAFVLGIVSEHDLLLKEESHSPGAQMKRSEADRAQGRTAGDVMHFPALCVGLDATLAEAARLMHKRSVKRLPVVDAAGRLVGIVSRHDLLKAFLRSDEAIRREICEDVLENALWIEPGSVEVTVRDGVVTLVGELETRSLIDMVDRLVGAVEGVVGVDPRLSFRFDDTNTRTPLPPMALHLSASER